MEGSKIKFGFKDLGNYIWGKNIEHMGTPLLLQFCQYLLLPSSLFGEDTAKQFSAAAFLYCEHGLVAVPQYSTQEEICLNTISIKFVYNDNQTLLVFVLSTQWFRLSNRNRAKHQGRKGKETSAGTWGCALPPVTGGFRNGIKIWTRGPVLAVQWAAFLPSSQ